MQNGTQRSLVTMLFLTIITGGLYYFYWVYVTTKEIEKFTKEKGIPPLVHVFLFLVTATLWGFVWDILMGQKIEQMQRRVGIPAKNNSGLYLLLDILGAGPVAGIGIVVPFLQQAELNEIYAAATVHDSPRRIW